MNLPLFHRLHPAEAQTHLPHQQGKQIGEREGKQPDQRQLRALRQNGRGGEQYNRSYIQGLASFLTSLRAVIVLEKRTAHVFTLLSCKTNERARMDDSIPSGAYFPRRGLSNVIQCVASGSLLYSHNRDSMPCL